MELHLYQKVEQTKELYRAMPTVLTGTVAVILLTLLLLWNAFSHQTLLIWAFFALLGTALRVGSYILYRKTTLTPANHNKWLLNYVFWSALAGFTWGIVTVLFNDPERPSYTLFLTCVFVGYVSAAASSSAPYLPSFFAFSLPASLLFFGQSAAIGGTLYNSIAIMILVYMVVMFSFARNAQALFKETKRLNYVNEDLMQQLREQKNTAENAMVAKNQFLAAASHDLRQPLHALNLFVDALHPLQNKQEGMQILGHIEGSVHALSNMMRGMLDISRLDASAIELNEQHISLLGLIEIICAEYLNKAEQKKVRFEYEIDPHLVLFTDSILLERVLRNLIDNAIKYTDNGSVLIEAKSIGDEAIICLKDTGKGIPEDEQENVFSEFHQLNNPERDRNQGLGLGLAIVKRLCKLMKVNLHLDSQHNVGTTITLRLPLGESNQIQCRVTKIISDEIIAGLDIIVIDDERNILEGMGKLLLNWQCHPILADSGEQALEILIEQDIRPDLIISDFRLRNNENGLDVVEQIRSEFNNTIAAILITGDTAPERIKLYNTANVTVLYKPIEPDALRESIQAVLTH